MGLPNSPPAPIDFASELWSAYRRPIQLRSEEVEGAPEPERAMVWLPARVREPKAFQGAPPTFATQHDHSDLSRLEDAP